MAKNLILFIAILPLMAMSCKKEKTDTLDITVHKWKLISVTIGNETFKPTENKSRYVLEFVSDSTFSLDLSVNEGGGKYDLLSKGEIYIYSFDALSEICCENDFDKKLLETFRKVTIYEVIGQTLLFKSTNGEVEFRKKW